MDKEPSVTIVKQYQPRDKPLRKTLARLIVLGILIGEATCSLMARKAVDFESRVALAGTTLISGCREAIATRQSFYSSRSPVAKELPGPLAKHFGFIYQSVAQMTGTSCAIADGRFQGPLENAAVSRITGMGCDGCRSKREKIRCGNRSLVLETFLHKKRTVAREKRFGVETGVTQRANMSKHLNVAREKRFGVETGAALYPPGTPGDLVAREKRFGVETGRHRVPQRTGLSDCSKREKIRCGNR